MYRAAIIGAGRIGAMADEPRGSTILSHAHAYSANEGFELVGFVDNDLNKAREASARWGGGAFSHLKDLFKEHEIDVVSVCVPDEWHFDVLASLATSPVRLIFLEKPAVRTAAQADAILDIYRGSEKRVLVNYTRRFVPEIRKLKERIQTGEFGSFITGVGYYGKGLVHNGSHLLDLLEFQIGEVGRISRLETTADYYEDDPSVSALLEMRAGGSFLLKHIDCRRFDIFEIDLTFERKRVRVRELGMVVEEYAAGENPVFQGYRTLNKEKEYTTQHQTAIYHAVRNIRNNLDGNEALLCTLAEASATIKTCERILAG